MKKHLTTALSIITIIFAAASAVDAQQQDIPAESKVYVGTFRFQTATDEGKFWISYDGAALKLERFSYRDAKGERDLKEVKIVRAESGPGYTIVGKTWQIKNLVPEKDGKVLAGDFERGTIKNHILYWREKE